MKSISDIINEELEPVNETEIGGDLEDFMMVTLGQVAGTEIDGLAAPLYDLVDELGADDASDLDMAEIAADKKMAKAFDAAWEEVCGNVELAMDEPDDFDIDSIDSRAAKRLLKTRGISITNPKFAQLAGKI